MKRPHSDSPCSKQAAKINRFSIDGKLSLLTIKKEKLLSGYCNLFKLSRLSQALRYLRGMGAPSTQGMSFKRGLASTQGGVSLKTAYERSTVHRSKRGELVPSRVKNWRLKEDVFAAGKLKGTSFISPSPLPLRQVSLIGPIETPKEDPSYWLLQREERHFHLTRIIRFLDK
jgi:hypothetical protein